MEEITTRAWGALDNPWVRAALVLTVSLIAARLAGFFLCHIVRLAARRTKTDIDDRIVDRLHGPIFVSVVLFGLAAITRVIALQDPYLFVTMGFLKTTAVVIWMVAGTRCFSILLEGLTRMADRVRWIEARTLPLMDNLGKLAIFSLSVYMVLVIWQLDVKPLLASAGIAGIAIGFAAKDTLANLFGGLFIVADAPYKLGDFIVLDTGERGQVTRIGLRSTRILTRDDVEITLPNAQIANAKIVNESGGPWEKARVAVTVGVAYGSDVDRVRQVLLDAAASVADIVDDPAPQVRFTEFGDSALIFRLLCWIGEPVMRGRALDALNTSVYKMFNAEGIQIPFPQRDVHMRPSG